jgi:hypothetical protein
MKDLVNSGATSLAQQITERYGLLLSQAQLAELLGRLVDGLRDGLRYSLKCPSDSSRRALKACGQKVGRRVYDPAAEAVRVILGGGKA